MTGKSRKPVWLYLLIAVSLVVSGTTLYLAMNRVQEYEEGAETYQELQEQVAAQSEALLAQKEEPTEEPYVPQGLEGEADDQDEIMWMIENNKDALAQAFVGQNTQGQAAMESPETQAAEATATPTPTVTPTPVSLERAREAQGGSHGLMVGNTVVASIATPTATERPTTAPQGELAGKGATEPPAVTQQAAQNAAQEAGESASRPTAQPAAKPTPTTSQPNAPAMVENTIAPVAVETPGSAPKGGPLAAPFMMEIAKATPAFTTAIPKLTPVPTYTPSATPTATPTPSPSPTPNITPEPTVEPWMQRAVEMDEVRYAVDFAYLQSLNPDVVAWLVQENTNINYPVMQAKDNDYYLTRMFNRRENKDGSLFMDAGNSKYFGDANTYVYGHNTKAGSMFSSLSNYTKQEYYNQHPRFILLTPYADFAIDLFACSMFLVEDESSWRLKQFERKADFDQYIKGLKARSFFKTDVTPEWGDQFLVLCTCTNVRHGQRYVVYGRMRPISYKTEQTLSLTKMNMDARPTQNGKRQVGPLGKLWLYAQNDDLWARCRYEFKGSDEKRRFGDGGAGPTAVAMAVANLVPKENLPNIRGYASATSGFTFCSCSSNQYFCNKLHAQYQVQTPEEFAKYLPMVMASFATGNNIWGIVGRNESDGTNLLFLEYIAGIYGLKLNVTKSIDDAVSALRRGAMAVTVTSGVSSPFTNGSHYVVLAGMDDQYMYILDPYRREGYRATDEDRVLEVITPNAVRVKLSDIRNLALRSFFILEKGE